MPPKENLRGIDAPELKFSKCQAETEQAIMAKATLKSLVPPQVRLVNVKPGKFSGRFVATVMAGTRDLADVLMENGVGRPYFKGKRQPWCNESMASIRERAARMKKSEQTDTPAAAKSKAYLLALAQQPA